MYSILFKTLVYSFSSKRELKRVRTFKNEERDAQAELLQSRVRTLVFILTRVRTLVFILEDAQAEILQSPFYSVGV